MIDRVVVVQSAAFTGSTWLCYVLASHRNSFSLGNPGKAWNLYQERGPNTCRVHYGNCPFWKKVADRNPSEDDFLHVIGELSGCSTLVLYNARDEPYVTQIKNGTLAKEVVRVVVIRDIRQRFASWKRRNKESSIFDAVSGFLNAPRFQAPSSWSGGSVIELRHEKLSTDRDYVVEKTAEITGLNVDSTVATYWKHEHHPAHGNGVTHSTCRYFQNPEKSGAELDPVYIKYLNDVENGKAFEFADNRWKEEISRFELYVIDQYAGEINAQAGYERDVFSEEEKIQFSHQLEAGI